MKQLLLLALGVLAISGCQTVPYQGQARDVKLKPQKEGIISIPAEYRDEDKMKAQTKMKQNCAPYAAEVLEEGEVVVGQKVDSTSSEDRRESSEHKVGKLFGIPVMSGTPGGKDVSGTSTTTSLKEWQISYKCDTKTVKK